MFGCQQVLIKTTAENKAVIEYLCRESNSLYNCSIYYARQIYFKTGKFLSSFDIATALKSNKHFTAGYVSAMQQTCLNAGEAFKSYKQLLKEFKKGLLEQKPKPPKYRKSGGLFVVTYPKKWLKIVNKQIRFPLGNQVKAWFGISEFFLPFPTNLNWDDIKEVRFLPRNNSFYLEFVYKVQEQITLLDKLKVLGIDPGLNNLLTCVSNLGNSFIIDGKVLKSRNQWYNKQISTMKDDKPQGFWSRTLASITEKRNRQMRDGVNKAARIVINYCLKNRIGRVVYGWNKGQKKEANLGKINNQKFVQVPAAKLKYRIQQLCEQYNIEFVETEESYTSKSSYLDSDELPTYGAKPNNWKSSGKRVKRGLFRTKNFGFINADCNGAANILRKVSADLGFDLSEVTRGVLTAPIRVRII